MTDPWRGALRARLETDGGRRPVLSSLDDQVSWPGEAILALGDAMVARIRRFGMPATTWLCDPIGAVTLGILAAVPELPGAVVAVDGDASGPEADRLAAAAAPDLVITSSGASQMAAWAAERGVPMLVAGAEGAELWDRNLSMLRHGASEPTSDLGVVTSGTVSGSRVVRLSPTCVMAALDGVRRFGDIRTDDLVLNVSPLHHTLGLLSGLLAPVMYGACVARGRITRLNAAGTVQERPTWCSVSPAALERLLARQPFGADWAPRVVRLSSAPVPGALAERIQQGSMDLPLRNAYVMSEAPGEISSAAGLESVGTGTVCEVEVVSEDGRPAPAGGSGEVWIRGPNVARDALLAEPEPFATPLLHEGWMPTGDRGSIGPGGLVLTGRISDLINCGGEKIAPETVEAVLALHPNVRDCVAFAVPHGSLGQMVGIAIVPGASTPTPRELRRFLLDRLPASHNPRHILTVGAIPTTPRGKRSRSKLAAHFGLGEPRKHS